MDSMPADLLMKLCSDFYDDEQIDLAKQLLHDLVTEMGHALPRFIKRRGMNKKNIVQTLLGTDNIPIFLAKDLSNLPPLYCTHFDISKVLSDIETLKNEMAVARYITESRTNIMAAIKDLQNGRKSVREDGTAVPIGQRPRNTSDAVMPSAAGASAAFTQGVAAIGLYPKHDVTSAEELSDSSITAVKELLHEDQPIANPGLWL